MNFPRSGRTNRVSAALSSGCRVTPKNENAQPGAAPVLQVVKSAGNVVPEFKQRFPKFETYRENIDGRYWFPTYTYGDDTLFFDKGGSLHIRMVIKYKNYRQFSSDVRATWKCGSKE